MLNAYLFPFIYSYMCVSFFHFPPYLFIPLPSSFLSASPDSILFPIWSSLLTICLSSSKLRIWLLDQSSSSHLHIELIIPASFLFDSPSQFSFLSAYHSSLIHVWLSLFQPPSCLIIPLLPPSCLIIPLPLSFLSDYPSSDLLPVWLYLFQLPSCLIISLPAYFLSNYPSSITLPVW
jgi:hypothetical protein